MATSKRNLYPKGQHASFAPDIGFGGNAQAAMTFYAQMFGAADLQITTFADAPKNQRPPGADDLVTDAQFTAAPGAVLMGCDIPPGSGTPGMGSTSVFHAAPDFAAASRLFSALADGGSVAMPLAATFWSPASGMVTDRFGTRWRLSAPPAAA